MKLQLRLNAFVGFLDNNFRWVVSVVVILVLVIGTFTLILPKWRTVSQLGLITLERERGLTKDREAYLAQLKQSLKKYQQFTEVQRDLLTRVLPTSFDVGKTFVEMSRLAADAGYDLSQIDVLLEGKTQATAASPQLDTAESADVQTLAEAARKNSEAVFLNENLRVVTLNLNLLGSQSYGDIKHLLNALERHEHLLDIRSMGFTIQDEVLTEAEAEASGKGDISIGANIYYFAETE